VEIQLPFIILEENDIIVFVSIEKAESYLEPYDLNLMAEYDSCGLELEFGIKKVNRKSGLWFSIQVETVVIRAKEPETINSEGLRQLLVEHLRKTRTHWRKPFVQRDWEQQSFSDLIKIAGEIWKN
jgi:hypothetical protein